jgi:hypothetical protein
MKSGVIGRKIGKNWDKRRGACRPAGRWKRLRCYTGPGGAVSRYVHLRILSIQINYAFHAWRTNEILQLARVRLYNLI